MPEAVASHCAELVKLQSVPPSAYSIQSCPGGTMGPAFATPVAPNAIADRAIAEAIVVIEIIFISRSPLTWMPTINMEIGDRGSDYKESNLR